MATPNILLNLPPYNSTNWNAPLNANFNILDAVNGSTLQVNFYGYDKILTQSECLNMRMNLTGNLGGTDFTLVFPNNIAGRWIVSNNTVSSGGRIFARTANYTAQPLLLTRGGSTFIFSDGSNIYSAVSGSEGAYLPLTGGNLTGPLSVAGNFTCDSVGYFDDGLTVAKGLTTLRDVKVLGVIDFSSSTITLRSLGIGTAPQGEYELAVAGQSIFDGDIRVNSGNLTVALGGVTITANSSVNSFNGTTTIPSGANLNIAAGGTLTVTGTQILAGQAPIRFLPSIGGAGMIRNDSANNIGFYADQNLTIGAYLNVTNGKFKASGGFLLEENGIDKDLGEIIASLKAEVASLKAEVASLKR